MPKPRATIDEQILSLRAHGVSFSLRSEDDARAFLTNNTYFYKLKSYARNYDTELVGANTYSGLDFEHLVELSLLDFSLSRLVWDMCSNIEHAVKVRFNKMLITSSDAQIAGKCLAACAEEGFSVEHDNPYTNDLQRTHAGDFALWHLWELSSFQQQLLLYNKGYQTITGAPNPQRHILFIVRKIRNAVSHGNCLMADLHRRSPSQQERHTADLEVTNRAMQMCGRKTATGTRLSALQTALDSLVVHNFAAVLLAHLEYVDSRGVFEHCQQEVEAFVHRVERHRDEYFGGKGAPATRNVLVNRTLEALTTLANSWLRRSNEKIKNLTS